MSEKTDSTNSRKVFLSVFLVGDSSYYKERKHIEDVLTDVFIGDYELDHEDPEGLQDREVVYCLSLPWSDEVEKAHAFQTLQVSMEQLSLYSPSFAQGTESIA